MADILDIISASPAHVEFMVNNLHPDDVEEIRVCGFSTSFGVHETVRRSQQVWVALAPEGPVCMWGVERNSTLLGGVAGWLLTSNLIGKYAKPFIRQAKPCIVALGEQYGYIENFVDSRHKSALRFFEWLGFNINTNGVLVGSQQIPFYRVCLRVH